MNARPRETQIPIGPLVAAAGGVLLIVSLGLDWYGPYSGFSSFEFLDLLLVVLALVTLASLAAALGLVHTPLRPGTPLVVGVVALLVVLSQLINHPPVGNERDVETGLWLGLAGAALMLAGAILSTARIAISVEPRGRASGASPPPAAAAPPAASTPPSDQAPTVADEPRP
jgi:hypothetical protein